MLLSKYRSKPQLTSANHRDEIGMDSEVDISEDRSGGRSGHQRHPQATVARQLHSSVFADRQRFPDDSIEFDHGLFSRDFLHECQKPRTWRPCHAPDLASYRELSKAGTDPLLFDPLLLLASKLHRRRGLRRVRPGVVLVVCSSQVGVTIKTVARSAPAPQGAPLCGGAWWGFEMRPRLIESAAQTLTLRNREAKLRGNLND